MQRKIIHIDMDAFFASVEQRDTPELRGKPVVVGFDGPRGVVSTASYEARSYGVHSAQPIVTAKRNCPHLVVVPPHFEKYKKVSQKIHEVLHEYTDFVEPLSLDEAFLEVTENKAGIELAVDVAREIKQKIFQSTRLTTSAGVSYNKFLAKIASDWRKPDGLTTIHPDYALDFIAELPIEKFWGIGPRMAERMHKMGIFFGKQLREMSLTHLKELFGKMGVVYYGFARGIDERPVIVERERKSVGCEQTFYEDLTRDSQLTVEIYHLTLELVRRIENVAFKGRTLTLKIKFSDFTQITRSTTQLEILATTQQILPLAKALLKGAKAEINYSAKHVSVSSGSYAIRLLGLSVSISASTALADVDMVQHWSEGWLNFKDFHL